MCQRYKNQRLACPSDLPFDASKRQARTAAFERHTQGRKDTNYLRSIPFTDGILQNKQSRRLSGVISRVGKQASVAYYIATFC